MKKVSLTTKIIIGLVLGLFFGIFLNTLDNSYFRDTILLNGILKLAGTGFLNAIKMLVIPLVFVSLVYATSSLNDVKKIGRIGSKTILIYLFTTTVAIIIALLVAHVINPGIGVNFNEIVQQQVTPTDPVPFVDTLLSIIPGNIFDALNKGNILAILFFAVFFGIGMTLVGEKSKHVFDLVESLNEIVLKLVILVMYFAPYGVFALISSTFANFGFQALLPLIKYVLAVFIALLLQVILVYMGLLVFGAKIKPSVFLKKFLPVLNIAFSTSSSNATLPTNLEVTEEKLGVSNKVASFTLPLGATINMDGTSIMQGVAVVFIAQIFNCDLSLMDYVIVILTAVLASVGTAGVPGAGMVMLSMVLASVGLPLEGIALVMGVDRIVDMVRTTVNITGDCVCTILIAKSENEFDENVYYDEN